MSRVYLAVFFAAILLIPFAASIDRPPTYDYANGRFNLTCTNSPPYNSAQRVLEFGPSGNQKCDPAVNWSTTEIASSGTPVTVFAWVRYNGTNPAGSSMHLLNIGFDFAGNSGYSFRTELNATDGLRMQVITGGAFNTGSFVPGYTTGQWIPVLYEAGGVSGRIIGRLGTASTISLNASQTGRNLNSTTGGNNQVFGSGTGGGYSNGMFNGTMKDIRVWNRSLTYAEIQSLFANETFRNTSGLVAYWSFENTTSVNITVSANAIANHSQDFLGFHTTALFANGSLIDVNNDGTLDSPSNISFLRSVFEAVGARLLRLDFNADEQCSYNTFLGTSANNCAWSTATASNGRNINFTRDIVDYAAARNYTVRLVAESVPATLAQNDSKCNYGAGSDWADCFPNNVTQWVDAIAEQFYYTTRGGVNAQYVEVEIWNEPYLQQFWLSNSLLTCADRAFWIVQLVNQSLPIIRQTMPNATILGPSVTFGASSCGPTVAAALGGNFSGLNSNSSQRFDLWNAHEYGSSGVMGIVSYNVQQQAATARQYGYSRWALSETLPNNAAVTQNDSARLRAETAHVLLTCHAENCTGANVFQLTSSRPWGSATPEWPIQYPQVFPSELGGPQVRGGAQAVNATQRLNLGEVRHTCTTTDSNVTCSVVRNGTRYQVVLASLRPNQLHVDNITFTSRTVSAAYSFEEMASKGYSGAVVAGGLVPYYAVSSWEVNVTDFTAPTISSVVNTSTTSTFQVNWSCNEACNGSVNYGLTTALGSRGSATGFTASQSVNVSGLLDSTTYYYNVTSCDAAGNCATVGPYSLSTVLTIVARSSVISSATNDRTSNLLLYCSGDVAGGGLISNGYQVWRNGALNISSPVPAYSGGVCTQSQFNASGTCGLTNGSYTVAAVSPGTTSGAYITVEAQKPRFAYNASGVRIKSGINRTGTGPHDDVYDVPSSCWSLGNNLTFRHFISSTTTTGRFRSDCWNGSAWLPLFSEIVCAGFSSGPTGSSVSNYDAAYDGNFSTGLSYYQTGFDQWLGTSFDTTNLSCGSAASGYAGVYYGMSVLWDYGVASNSTDFVGSVPSSSLAKGQNWTLSCYASDGLQSSTYLNSSVFTVGNARPNASGVAATAITGGVNCTYTYADPDSDAESGSTYRWFRNGSLLASTSRTLASGNYTLADRVVCEVTPRDGTTFGLAVNGSEYVSGDITPPVLSSISVPSVATNADVVRVTAVCTDDGSIAGGYPVLSWTNPNGTKEVNRSMTQLSGSTYYLDWVYLSTGYYSAFTTYCRDGTGNEASLSTSTTLAVTENTGGSSGGGGGGGGTAPIVLVSGAGVEIVRPASRTFSSSCVSGTEIQGFDVQLYNPTGSDSTYSLSVRGLTCGIIPDVSIPAKGTRTVEVSGCGCPDDGQTVKGVLEIVDARSPGAIAASLPITLSENLIAFFLRGEVVIASVVIVGLVVLFVALGARR